MQPTITSTDADLRTDSDASAKGPHVIRLSTLCPPSIRPKRQNTISSVWRLVLCSKFSKNEQHGRAAALSGPLQCTRSVTAKDTERETRGETKERAAHRSLITYKQQTHKKLRVCFSFTFTPYKQQ